MPTRKRYHHGNLKIALLDAALEILDVAGPDAVTIREVARQAGVSHAAPANHFKDRRTLLTELGSELFDQLSGKIERKIGSSGEVGTDRVRSFAVGLIEYGLQYPQRYRMLWRRDLVYSEDSQLVGIMDGIYDSLTAEISALALPSATDPHTVAIGLWSLAHGYVSMRLDGVFEAATDIASGRSRMDAIIDTYLSSLIAR